MTRSLVEMAVDGIVTPEMERIGADEGLPTERQQHRPRNDPTSLAVRSQPLRHPWAAGRGPGAH